MNGLFRNVKTLAGGGNDLIIRCNFDLFISLDDARCTAAGGGVVKKILYPLLGQIFILLGVTCFEFVVTDINQQLLQIVIDHFCITGWWLVAV